MRPLAMSRRTVCAVDRAGLRVYGGDSGIGYLADSSRSGREWKSEKWWIALLLDGHSHTPTRQPDHPRCVTHLYNVHVKVANRGPLLQRNDIIEVKNTKEGNSLLWGGPPCGCPVRPPWVCCGCSRFGPFGCGGFVPATHTYHTSTSQHLHNPYSNSVSDINPYSTLQLFFPSHPPYNSNYITDTRGLRSPSVLDFLS
jgi:hypothetical protein